MKFAADENFDNRILRGLQRHLPDLDVVRIQDTAIAGADDSIVLEWAAREGRILLTHDEKTVPQYAYERIGAEEMVAGVIVVSDTLSIRSVIEDLLIIATCSSAPEWVNQIQRLPL
ncbi:MAG TPA: DUF5615 family PIN-like protein [Chloroflexota bacterium]|nr:DUF5615 family PIN-like protein [Chloroflexota bacterium]